MKETNFKLCKCDDTVFDTEVITQVPVVGVSKEFVVHMADFYDLPDDVQAKIEHKDMSID